MIFSKQKVVQKLEFFFETSCDEEVSQFFSAKEIALENNIKKSKTKNELVLSIDRFLIYSTRGADDFRLETFTAMRQALIAGCGFCIGYKYLFENGELHEIGVPDFSGLSGGITNPRGPIWKEGCGWTAKK